ncbi:MAG: SH3 domain-containing protein [Chloroflexota bacterium]
MFKKSVLLIACLLCFALPAFAQDVPDEIDDPTGNIENVIEQLADDGYISDKGGEVVFEENRIRFDNDDDIFIPFDTPDFLTNFVMAATLQIDGVDDEDYQFCLLTYRDTADDGFHAVGVTSFATVDLYDIIFEEDTEGPIDFDSHGEDVDEEIHIIVVALDDEITIYVDGELFYEEDDLSVREGFVGLLRSEGVDCDADDVWVWELEESNLEPPSRDDDDDDRDTSSSSSSDLPDEIDDFDGASEDVMLQFEEAGIVGSGNAFLFGEDYAFISRTGGFFTTLGRNRNRTDVIMGVELTFDSESSRDEECGILLRVDDSVDPVEEFLFIGIDGDGTLIINDGSEENSSVFNEFPLDLDDTIHLIVVARGEELALYIDGELVLSGYEIYETRGIFGVAMFTDDTGSNCEIRNMWVYDTPFFEPGVCNVVASGNVNQRSGPSTSTEIAGQLSSGETLEVISQTEPGDGFIWYELEDDSYVREDIISLVGDCNDIDES